MRGLSSEMIKLARKPASGVYYAVPKDRTFSNWEIKYIRNDETNEPLHFEMWFDLVDILKHQLNLTDEEARQLGDNYTGLPRGRVLSPQEIGTGDKWIVSHGDDTPEMLKHQILTAFGLLPLNRVGKVVWSVDDHEKMNPQEKELVWGVLKK